MRPPMLAASLLAAALGCSEGPSIRFTTDASVAANDAGAAELDAAADVAATPLDVGRIPVRDNGPIAQEALVYAHSDTTLYAVDPRANPPRFSQVADFSFPRGTMVADMTDIAVGADGTIMGTAGDAVWRIDPRTAACTRVVALPERRFFVGLSWVPAGVVDRDVEVLVGATTDGALWRIDLSSGRATMLFTLPRASGQSWTISGDLVSIDGDATYITLRREGASSTAPDVLGVVDFSSRSLRIVSTEGVGFSRVFGLGYWRQTLYGFTRAGEFITINTRTSQGRRVSMPTMQFSGAGVTTLASIEAPP